MTRQEYAQLVETVREQVTERFEERFLEAEFEAESEQDRWASIIALLTVRSDEFVSTLLSRIIDFDD